jgi:Ribose/xylose/arabinose/galactoside ABC-type transport systems, permease components
MNRKTRMNSSTMLVLITILLFIGMYAIGCVIYQNKGFGTFQTFLNVLINNSGLLCIVCGMTAVMLTAGIDISVGSLVAMDCMFLAVGMGNGVNAIVMVLLVLAIGVVFGLVQGFFISYLNIQPFIMTMAGLFFARGMTAVISTNQVSITEAINPMFYGWANIKINLPAFLGYVNNNGVTMVPFVRIPVIIAIACVVVTFIMLRYTKFGRGLYAVGGNEDSAKMLGLNVRVIKLKAYVLSSVLCSIGGICYCMNTMSGSVQQAMGLEMQAIAAAVIGGTLLTGGAGNVIGSFFGVLIIGTITTLVNTNGKLLSSWSSIAVAALLCLFIVLQAIFAVVRERTLSNRKSSNLFNMENRP